MPKRRWALGRVLLIWCAWPLLLVVLLLALGFGLMRAHGGFSLDLLHTSGWTWALVGAVLVGPPLLATIAWGRQNG